MTKMLFLSMFVCFLSSIAVVVGLVGLSEDIREKPGSFLRQYPPHPVIESDMIALGDDHYYFAGVTTDKVYLANALRPLEILTVKSDMLDTSVVRLNIPIGDRLKYFRITVSVDSPYFYFMDGAIPYVYRGALENWQGERYLMDSTFFIDAVPLSGSSFAICALSARTNEKALGKMSVRSGDVTLNYDLLERQFDGVFDVDGAFAFDKPANTLVYLYYYRNQYIVADTNLNLKYRGNTIDTFSIAQVKTAEIRSEKAVGLSAPPVTTNKSHAVYRRWLFIHSLLPASNEYMDEFEKASIVDVYDLNSGEYQFSFYVFDEGGEKMKSFIVGANGLYALFPHSIRRYDLLDKYFPGDHARKDDIYPGLNQE